jgi:hypothetical protein
MELLIGPAIIAALVSGIVSVAGWWVTFRTSMRIEQMRRDEKVHDFQVALRAEIASDLLNTEVIDRAAHLDGIRKRYETEAGYSVFVPYMASNAIFESIVKDIHILPGEVIAPIVDYARLRQTVEKFVLDLRADKFAQLSNDRQLAMYSDYLGTLDRVEALAEHAVAAIDRSLGTNTLGAVRSSRLSVSGSGGASPVPES